MKVIYKIFFGLASVLLFLSIWSISSALYGGNCGTFISTCTFSAPIMAIISAFILITLLIIGWVKKRNIKSVYLILMFFISMGTVYYGFAVEDYLAGPDDFNVCNTNNDCMLGTFSNRRDPNVYENLNCMNKKYTINLIQKDSTE